MLYAGDEITPALDAEPEGFDVGFAVALAGEESAELCDQVDDLANSRHLRRWLLLVEDKGAGPFGFGEEQIGRPLRADASQADQAGKVQRKLTSASLAASHAALSMPALATDDKGCVAPRLYSAAAGRVVSNGRSLSAWHPIYRLVEDSANHARP